MKKTIATLLTCIMCFTCFFYCASAEESLKSGKEKIDPALLEYIENTSEDRIPVSLWLVGPELPSDDERYEMINELRKSSLSSDEKMSGVQEIIALQRRLMASIIEPHNEAVLSTFPESFELSFLSHYAPVIDGYIDREDIFKLAENEMVTDVYLNIEEWYVDETVLGDVNVDGDVTAEDARLALRNSAQLEELNTYQIANADIDGDGEVTASDAREILLMSANIR